MFGLGIGEQDRSSIFLNLDATVILPHVAQQSGQKYSFEHTFRSLMILFADTAHSEYYFNKRFFKGLNPEDLTTTIFDKVMKLIKVDRFWTEEKFFSS